MIFKFAEHFNNHRTEESSFTLGLVDIKRHLNFGQLSKKPREIWDLLILWGTSSKLDLAQFSDNFKICELLMVTKILLTCNLIK